MVRSSALADSLCGVECELSRGQRIPVDVNAHKNPLGIEAKASRGADNPPMDRFLRESEEDMMTEPKRAMLACEVHGIRSRPQLETLHAEDRQPQNARNVRTFVHAHVVLLWRRVNHNKTRDPTGFRHQNQLTTYVIGWFRLLHICVIAAKRPPHANRYIPVTSNFLWGLRVDYISQPQHSSISLHVCTPATPQSEYFAN